MSMKNWIWVIIAIALASFLVGYGGKFKTSSLLGGSAAKKVAQQAVDYINKNLLQDSKAELEKVEEESGVYKFTLKVGNQEFDSYITKDGKYLFPQGLNLQEEVTTTTAPKKTCSDLKKEKKPLLEAFVVSRCPFGLQMQRVLDEIVKNIPELTSYIRVEYMGDIVDGKISSMHGEEEAQENLRQICLREEQPDKYWQYLDCHIKKGDVEPCLDKASVDISQLTNCMEDSNRGLSYAKEDFERQNKYGVTGSPTLVLNGEEVAEFDFGGRSAEAVKTLLCCGFTQQPSFCSQQLTTDQAAPSFSPTYSSQSKTQEGSCG